MRYILPLLLLFLTLITLTPQKVSASAKVAGASASLFAAPMVAEKEDSRATTLEKYLNKYNSPLAPYAKTFVKEADKNNIDWKLLVAISGVESTFGKHIPVNSYNGWGWGIYGNQTKRFDSWEDAIATISKGLRDNYIDKWGAKTVADIGRIYAASPTWSSRVIYFDNEIEIYAKQSTNVKLSISI